eukprot:7906590-Pyramimonas_sp.AAC.1
MSQNGSGGGGEEGMRGEGLVCGCSPSPVATSNCFVFLDRMNSRLSEGRLLRGLLGFGFGLRSGAPKDLRTSDFCIERPLRSILHLAPQGRRPDMVEQCWDARGVGPTRSRPPPKTHPHA